jgi:uncharacterized protein (TIGR03790 family)
VLVVINEDSETSKTVGEYYAKCRAVPASNVLRLRAALSEETSQTEFESDILAPIRAATNTCPNRIDYVVLTKGIPIRIREGGYSVDGKIAAMDLPARDVGHGVRLTPNPFFLQNAPFDSSRYGMLLVTRLDGYDAADCERLVDDSLKAGSETGPFFFDPAKNRTGGAYGLLQEEMFDAAGSLRGKGLKIEIGKAGAFSAPDEPLAGYCSWGSNDSSFNRDVYGRLRFKPGALAETFVSTDGRTFSDRYSRGQSLVADLIAQGVTGVKGYVSEPYIFALAHPQVLWDRYTSGYDLAESFYMASAVLGWKDVVIGDPLCRPYKSLSH